MAKKITQNIGKQLGQFGENIFETASKQPEKKISAKPEKLAVKTSPPEDINLEQIKQQKAIQTRQQIVQLEKEIRRLVGERRRQQEEWRRVQEEKMTQKTPLKESPPSVSSKRRRGLLGFWSRRVKTAQEQAKPEMVGKRVGG